MMMFHTLNLNALFINFYLAEGFATWVEAGPFKSSRFKTLTNFEYSSYKNNVVNVGGILCEALAKP